MVEMDNEPQRRRSAPDLAMNRGPLVAAGHEKTRRNSMPALPPMLNAPKRRRSSLLSEGADSSGEQELRKTDKAVRWLRASVIITLLVATATVATITFVYVSRAEQSEFDKSYSGVVTKVADSIQSGIDAKVFSASTFSAIYTSRYGGDDATWPNATMPGFEEQAISQLRLSFGRALSFNPVLTSATRAEWEAHALENVGLLGSNKLVVRETPDSWIVADGVYRRENDTRISDPGWDPHSQHPDVLVPVWQIAPMARFYEKVMLNLKSDPITRQALDVMLTYNMPVMTAILQLVTDVDMRPTSVLYYPVRRSFGNASSDRDIVGTISIVFSWDDVLRNILPQNAPGLICVLKSSLGQAYTYVISGGDVELLGEGDLHGSRYDKNEYVVDAKLRGNVYESNDIIAYQLFIYPSVAFEERYKTSRPAAYTVGAVLIFVFTASLFFFYDYLVRRRQTKLSKAAKRSGQIVDSLFPAMFRDRLFKHQESVKVDQAVRKGSHHARERDKTIRSLKAFVSGNSDSRNPEYNVGANLASSHTESPIAETYPDTSIMFCDVVGFTAWSSQHSPNEVFQLLEALFWEFDLLADQLGVFKLGTIGDCYIAVTGLPEPVKDHASVLAEFAVQCKKKVAEVRLNLAHLDTSGLTMRFGIHSGPVTAGILRGHKSRFELFGDTINTASRMESTGIPDRIQVSSETAALLREEGMGSWLVPREGHVAAKGKGNLCTFWLIPPDEEDFYQEDEQESGIFEKPFSY